MDVQKSTTADGTPRMTIGVEHEELHTTAMFFGFHGYLTSLMEHGLLTKDQRDEITDRALDIAEGLADGQIYDPFQDRLLAREDV